MSQTLLDTNVVSELIREQPDPRAVTFIASCDDAIVSAVVFHEISYGIERLRDALKRAQLELFLEGVKHLYASRIIDVNLQIAELGGRLRAAATNKGWTLSQMDSLIAATAMARGARLATRNVSDFERLNIPLIDPWQD